MSTKDKLIARFKTLPKDFTFEEVVRVFGIFGFTIGNKGKTSGSRVVFTKEDVTYVMHKPHPSNIVKESALKSALNYLKRNCFID
ncbi:MAG: type II toxin-antitoxin system HicA family toxin [Victivallales bacterium]|jgi:hypothetical protein|nr:type II toxin-antitoxin system HicA family toxin [Victivallales bacterium]